MKDIIFTVIILGLFVMILALLSFGAVECNKQRGKYVRSLFWMECIK